MDNKSIDKKTNDKMQAYWENGFSVLFERIQERNKERVANGEKIISLPSKDTAFTAMARCINARGNEFKWRKTKPSDDYPQANLLFKLVKFYRGNGNLWGYPMLHGNQFELDQFDTLAQLITLYENDNNAAVSWHNAFYGK